MSESTPELKPGTIIWKETGMPRFVKVTKARDEELEVEDDEVEEVSSDEEEEGMHEGVEEGEEIEFGEEEIAEDLEGKEEEEEHKVREQVDSGDQGDDSEKVFEEGEELMETKVELPTALKDFAKMYSLPTYEMKLLPQKIKRRVYKYELVYPAKERLQVGPDGELLPIPSTPHRIRYMDDVKIRRRLPSPDYNPTMKIEPNPYDPRLPIGAYVTSTKDGVSYSGPVVAFDQVGVSISVHKNGEIEVINVPYTEPSIRVTQPPAKKVEEVKKQMPDVRELQEVPAEIRAIMVDSYVASIERITSGRSAPEEKPSQVPAQIVKQMEKEPIVTFESFYAMEFSKWVRAKNVDQIIRDLDKDRILKEAQSMAVTLSDDKNLISEVFEGITVDENTTVSELLARLQDQIDITALQAHVIRALNQEVLAGNGHWKGKMLAGIITNTIQEWRYLSPVNTDEIYKMLIDISIRAQVDTYEPTAADEKEFESQYLAAIKVLYDEYLAKRKDIIEKAAPEKEVEATKSGITTSSPKVNVRAKVEGYERTVMATSSSLYQYMVKILRPYIFLEGPLAKHAKFFHAKLAAGKFDVELLGEANLAHFLPELTMVKITDTQWNQVFATLDQLVELVATKILGLYTMLIHPTARIHTTAQNQNPYMVAASLVNLLKDPRDMCEGGRRPVVKDGRYVYRPGTDTKIMEPIPLGDMVICYSNGKFTCHDSSQLSRLFSKGEYVNPFTKQPYPEDFVEKIKDRYPGMGDEPVEPTEEERKVLEKTTKIKERPLPPPKPLPVPKATKKKTGKYTTKILLSGAPFEVYLLFDRTVQIKSTDGSIRMIEALEKDGGQDISIFGFDHIPTVSDLKRVGKSSGDRYVVIEASIPFRDRSAITKKLKGKDGIKDVLYMPKYSDDYDLLLAVQGIVNDFEGGVQKQK